MFCGYITYSVTCYITCYIHCITYPNVVTYPNLPDAVPLAVTLRLAYPYTFIPKNVTKISQFFTKNFPVLAPTSGNRKCIRNGKYFLRFYTKIFPVSDTLFIPISETLFIPVSDTLFIPVSDTLFIPIPFLSTFLFPPSPEPFLTPPPMQPCTHIQCPVPNFRIGHNSEQLECIAHL